jgi:hypothetical protein
MNFHNPTPYFYLIFLEKQFRSLLILFLKPILFGKGPTEKFAIQSGFEFGFR